jgi:peptide deformylase
MEILKIYVYPNPILYKKAEQVDRIDDNICSFVRDMEHTMRSVKAVGLAANQVGVPKKIIVMDDNQTIINVINPEIIKTTGSTNSEEGCLSLPGDMWKIKRAKKVVLRGMNIKGEKIEIRAVGLLARIIQHEVDHLNGILIKDRASFLQKQIKKIKRKKYA